MSQVGWLLNWRFLSEFHCIWNVGQSEFCILTITDGIHYCLTHTHARKDLNNSRLVCSGTKFIYCVKYDRIVAVTVTSQTKYNNCSIWNTNCRYPLLIILIFWTKVGQIILFLGLIFRCRISRSSVVLPRTSKVKANFCVFSARGRGVMIHRLSTEQLLGYPEAK